jgi:hypothetical protein
MKQCQFCKTYCSSVIWIRVTTISPLRNLCEQCIERLEEIDKLEKEEEQRRRRSEAYSAGQL